MATPDQLLCRLIKSAALAPPRSSPRPRPDPALERRVLTEFAVAQRRRLSRQYCRRNWRPLGALSWSRAAVYACAVALIVLLFSLRPMLECQEIFQNVQDGLLVADVDP